MKLYPGDKIKVIPIHYPDKWWIEQVVQSNLKGYRIRVVAKLSRVDPIYTRKLIWVHRDYYNKSDSYRFIKLTNHTKLGKILYK